MSAVAHISTLYSAAPLIVWVEDEITRDYLANLWGSPPDIALYIAGSGAAIPPTIETAFRENIPHVFGLMDRDFGKTNFTKWNDRSDPPRVFRLPRHEIENYLLDAQAIQACQLNNRDRSIDEVNNELVRLADQQPVWLACRQVISRMRQSLLEEFPRAPTIPSIKTITDAESYIVQSSWYANLQSHTDIWLHPDAVLNALRTAEAEYRICLSNGSWQTEFSGKEIIRQIRSFVYQPPQNPGRPDSDFAKVIGDWQRTNQQIPTDLDELLKTLRSRIAG